MLTFVLDNKGQPLMPTHNIRKIRRLLKSGRAVICGHDPFTVKLLYDLPEQEAPHTQPVELCMDTGKEHIGLSIKSEKHEFVHAHYDNLKDEKLHHDDCRKYRRARRNRKRYRKPRFDNRKATKKEGWMAPSIRHAKDNHIALYRKYKKVCPITDAFLEVATFDTQALEAIEAGMPLPKGKDYQQGPRYRTDTLREAVFARDKYTCQVCGATPFTDKKKSVILQVHHALYWKNDHTDRMSGLMTVCTKCHTSKNHAKGGALYGITPKVKSLAGAAFMNQVRWVMYTEMQEICKEDGVSLHLTYGTTTKRERHSRRIAKTHANDAYCIGQLRPKHKAREVHYRKRRRNERVLAKFYDAEYIDFRTGEKKKASALGCNRTNRGESRHSKEKNERIYRGKKVRCGSVSVKAKRAKIPTGSIVLHEGKKYFTSGMHCNNTRVILKTPGKKQTSVASKHLTAVRIAGGYVQA